MNYGLPTDDRGCPVSVAVFDGNTGDPKTLLPQVEKVRDVFGIDTLVMVGDPHMRQAWTPLLFADEATAEQKADRDPVALARRSQVTLDKVHSRQLADGTPAMSFTRLLAHMASIVRNTARTVAAKPGAATFTLTTPPNPKQRHALDLIAAITV